MLATEIKTTSHDRFPAPSMDQVLTLCRTEGPCISLFLGPYVAGSGSQSSAAALTAMLPNVQAALAECGVHPQDAAPLLEPLRAMREDPMVTGSHRESICIYRSPRALHCFHVQIELEPDWRVDEFCVIGPLLAHLDYRRNFLLLALAGKRIRLFHCQSGSMEAIPIPSGVPESEAEFVGVGHGDEHQKNRAFGVQFGSSDGREKSPHFRRAFLTAIDRGLQPLFRSFGLPLVVAGVEEQTAGYAAVSGYAALLPEPVRMSPDGGATDAELAEAAGRIMKGWRNSAEQHAVDAFHNVGPARRLTEYPAILQAANAGQVQHLFIAAGERCEGLAAGTHVYLKSDLSNAAAIAVLLHKGMVWLVEPGQMPATGSLAAVLRYAGGTSGE